jgi:hypothetical protein
MTTIRGPVGRGGKNQRSDVRAVQELLNNNILPPLDVLDVDGVAGAKTLTAIEEFQKRVLKMSNPDGRVDPDGPTFRALLGNAPTPTKGPPPVEGPKKPSSDAAWWPKQVLHGKGEAWARQTFGDFEYTPKPAQYKKQPITILGGWEGHNIVTVDVPQLKGVQGNKKGHVRFHKKAADQLKALWAAWEDEGLLYLVKTWDGGFYPRYQAGSTTKLSNHSWGSAFDINAGWNGFGARPPAVGKPGSVLLMVPTAQERGFAWGGYFPTADGMHFEVAELK